MLALSLTGLAFNAPAVPLSHAVAVTRAAEPAMFTGGARAAPKKKVAPKKAPAGKKGPGKAQGLFSGGVAPAKGKTKLAVSSKPTVQTYIDVSGREYQEVSTFVPQFDEIGVLPPIGRWDPLKIREQGPERYRRFVEMEIKHGRLAMAAFLGVITTYSGIRWPGYLSKAEGILFSDLPGGAISSWAALPTAAWFQIVLFISICETVWLKQDPDKAPGDVVPEGVAWARYPDGYEVAGRRLDQGGGRGGAHPGQDVEAQRRAQQRARRDDGHHWHAHPRGPDGQPRLPHRRDALNTRAASESERRAEGAERRRRAKRARRPPCGGTPGRRGRCGVM